MIDEELIFGLGWLLAQKGIIYLGLVYQIPVLHTHILDYKQLVGNVLLGLDYFLNLMSDEVLNMLV